MVSPAKLSTHTLLWLCLFFYLNKNIKKLKLKTFNFAQSKTLLVIIVDFRSVHTHICTLLGGNC